MAQPPLLIQDGEFRVTFRVHDRSHNEVQKLETPMRTPLLTTSEKMANLQTPGLRPGLHSVAAPRLNRGTKGMPSVSNTLAAATLIVCRVLTAGRATRR